MSYLSVILSPAISDVVSPFPMHSGGIATAPSIPFTSSPLMILLNK
jgi:hypothetical protein